MTKVSPKWKFEVIDDEFAGETQSCELFLVIHHQDSPQILLSKHDLQLPSIQVKPQWLAPWYETTLWIPKVREKFGFSFDICFLRAIWYSKYGLTPQGDVLYQAVLVLDSHGDVTEPPHNTKWEHFSHIPVPHPDANDAIEALITECRTTTQPALRPFFARPGWFREMRNWMEFQLTKNGFEDIREVKQNTSRYRGTVIQANTNRGLVYVKSSPFFVNEALVAETMSKLLPEHVETPIAVDVDKRLLLTRDYGEIIAPIRMDIAESEQWSTQLAKIHQATVGKEDVLQKAGLKVIPVEMLSARLEEIFEFVAALGYVSDDILEQFKELWPQIRSDCGVVEEIGVPMTFIHGDIALDNVYRPAVAGGYYGMMDWADAAISHPFFDAALGNDPSAYVGSWHCFLSRTRPEGSEAVTLERLFDCDYLCFRLLPLFYLVRLYLETFEIESPMPVQMRKELKDSVGFVVRTYACNKRRVE